MSQLSDRAFVGADETRARLKRIRLVRRWTLADCAKRAKMSAGTLSAIESGKTAPTEDQIASLADAFGYEPRFLTAQRSLTPTTRPWLRAYADASKREADARTALATLAIEYVRALRLKPLPDLIYPMHGDLDDPECIEEAAAEVRHLAGLEADGVVLNAVRAAERLGCVVLPLESEMGRHMGMSVRSDEIPVICASKSGVPGDRQRFTVAHEIGHLALHGSIPPPRDAADSAAMERQANRFAAAFLGPGDALVATLEEISGGKVTLTALAEVKAVWGIAIKGLVGRFKSLGVIDASHAESLYKQISARRWTKAEPVEVPTESAQWFQRSLMLATGSDDVRQACRAACAEIGGNGADLNAFVDWSDVGGVVIPMSKHR